MKEATDHLLCCALTVLHILECSLAHQMFHYAIVTYYYKQLQNTLYVRHVKISPQVLFLRRPMYGKLTTMKLSCKLTSTFLTAYFIAAASPTYVQSILAHTYIPQTSNVPTSTFHFLACMYWGILKNHGPSSSLITMWLPSQA